MVSISELDQPKCFDPHLVVGPFQQAIDHIARIQIAPLCTLTFAYFMAHIKFFIWKKSSHRFTVAPSAACEWAVG